MQKPYGRGIAVVKLLLRQFMAVVGAFLTTVFLLPFIGCFEGKRKFQYFITVVFLCTVLSFITWTDYEFNFVNIAIHSAKVAACPLFALGVLHLVWTPLNLHRKGRFWQLTREYTNRIYSKHFISFIDTPFFVSLFVICWLHLLV